MILLFNVDGVDTISLEEDSFCEHCCQLEPFTTVFEIDGTLWCYDCVICDPKVKISEQSLKDIRYFEAVAKIKYFEQKLEHWRDIANETVLRPL